MSVESPCLAFQIGVKEELGERSSTIVLCAHSEWRTGGYRRGRRAGDTIGSWLGHSVVCLGPHSLWVGARSASRSKMRGACLRASSRRVGGHPKRADCR